MLQKNATFKYKSTKKYLAYNCNRVTPSCRSRPERSPRGALHSFPQPRPQGAFPWLFFPNLRLLALSHILFTLGEKSDGFCC